jgi:hypothetical protein
MKFYLPGLFSGRDSLVSMHHTQKENSISHKFVKATHEGKKENVSQRASIISRKSQRKITETPL